MKYRIFFKFKGQEHSIELNKDVSHFSNGFWLDVNMWSVFTRITDPKYWIPPSQLIRIEIIEK